MANVPLLLAVFFAIATVVYGDKGAKAKTNKLFKSMKSTKASKANASKSNDVLKSVSQIQFDNESNTLFVVDWKQEKILAFLLPPISDNTPAEGSPYGLNIHDLGAKIGFDHVTLEAIAVRPNSYDAYAALTVGGEGIPIIAVFRVDEANLDLEGGSYEILPLSDMTYTSIDIKDVPSKDELWFSKDDDPVNSYLVTSMQFHKGRLYAAGLASLDAASVIRIFDFPFTGSYKTVSVETYNVSHQQFEKRAPLRHFIIEEVDLEQWGDSGERLGTKPTDCIVAALLCTPLAYIPVEEVNAAAEKETVRTRAIAEIGDGGTPLSFFKFSAMGFNEAVKEEKIMMVGLYRNTKIIPWETIVKAMNASKDGIQCGKGGAPWVFDGHENGDLAGMDFGIVGPYASMTFMPDLSGAAANRLVGLRRDIKTGRAELLSSLTSLTGTRLSDMTIEEYWWNSYEPDPNGFNQKVMQSQYDSFKLEGYPDAIPPLIEEVTSPMPCTYSFNAEPV